MPNLDIFNSDAFSLRSMVAAVQAVPYKPGRIGELGLFRESGMSTVVAMVELRDGQLELIASSARGAPGLALGRPARTAVPIAAAHLVRTAHITADEIQGVRAFGSETETELVQAVVNDRLATLRAFQEVTLEYHRIGAIKGQVLDADGATVLLDLFTTFNVVQQTHAVAFTDQQTVLRDELVAVARLIEDDLGGIPYSGIRIFAGKDWFDALVSHASVRTAYQLAEASQLRVDLRRGFVFGGATTEEYRGSVSGQKFVPDTVAYAVPEGTDVFMTKFAPADYMETVNTLGLPIYAKIALDEKFQKFVDIECQANPLALCTRPRSIIKLTMS